MSDTMFSNDNDSSDKMDQSSGDSTVVPLDGEQDTGSVLDQFISPYLIVFMIIIINRSLLKYQ